jgi:hypothetical protein
MELAQCTSRLLCAAKLSHREARRLTNPKRTVSKQKKTALELEARVGSSRRTLVAVNARASGGAAESDTSTAVVTGKPESGRFQVSQGYPMPFGATARDGGVNFAIYSANAVSAVLCLISLSDLQDVSFIRFLRLCCSSCANIPLCDAPITRTLNLSDLIGEWNRIAKLLISIK